MRIIRMRLLRAKKGKSQPEIAKEIGLDQSVYSLIESGRLKPSLSQEERLGNYFKEPVERLLRPIRIKNANDNLEKSDI